MAERVVPLVLASLVHAFLGAGLILEPFCFFFFKQKTAYEIHR